MRFYAVLFCLTLFSFFFGCLPVRAEVIFQDNFDSHADWTRNQSPTQNETCIVDCDVPSGWDGYYNGFSYCPGGPGHNNFYIHGDNARGGSGKSITFWDESCVDTYEDSDGDLGKRLNQIYDEIYIRFYIKFQPGFQWKPSGASPHKLMHLQRYCGSGVPWSYFGTDCNLPVTVPGIKTYGGDVYYYTAYRCEESYYCQGTPSYDFDVGTDQDHVNLGPWSSILGDGQWHSMEFHYRMNTNNGSVFHADGEHRFWLDGELKYESTNIPFSDNGSDQDPRRGWNFFSIGGNNKNRWTTSCTGIGCEQWYSVDDVVVATEYIGPGAPPPSSPIPSIIDLAIQ